MSNINDLRRILQDLKARHGLDVNPNDLAPTFHLMNTFKLDLDTALDQSSAGANDHGIDAWHITSDWNKLYLFQSKFSENKSVVLHGLDDLERAYKWFDEYLAGGEYEEKKINRSLKNLVTKLGKIGRAHV